MEWAFTGDPRWRDKSGMMKKKKKKGDGESWLHAAQVKAGLMREVAVDSRVVPHPDAQPGNMHFGAHSLQPLTPIMFLLLWHGPVSSSSSSIFNVFTPKGICRGAYWACAHAFSVSGYSQHCEPNSECKNLEKNIYGVGWTWWKCVERR